MSMFHRRLLESATLSADSALDLESALDLGHFRELHIVLTVNQAAEVAEGTTAKLVLRHAAVNGVDQYVDFDTPAEIDLSREATVWFHVDSFLRYVGWFVSGTLTGAAVVTIDVIGKG